MSEQHYHSYCRACAAGSTFTDRAEAIHNAVILTGTLSASMRVLGHRNIAYLCKYDRAHCDPGAWTPEHAAEIIR